MNRLGLNLYGKCQSVEEIASNEIIEFTREGYKGDWNGRGIGHELQCLQDLRPAGFIVVAHTVLGGYGQAAPPDTLETRFLDDLGAQAIVSLTDEFELAGF